jgi:hypothetical protein
VRPLPRPDRSGSNERAHLESSFWLVSRREVDRPRPRRAGMKRPGTGIRAALGTDLADLGTRPAQWSLSRDVTDRHTSLGVWVNSSEVVQR